MVLKDVECTRCGRRSEALMDGSATTAYLDCRDCGAEKHITICNGGCGSRYRYLDWDGVDFSERVRLGKLTCETRLPESQGGGVITDQHKSGVACQDMPRFSADGRAENLSRVRFDKRKRQGRGRIFVDLAR